MNVSGSRRIEYNRFPTSKQLAEARLTTVFGCCPREAKSKDPHEGWSEGDSGESESGSTIRVFFDPMFLPHSFSFAAFAFFVVMTFFVSNFSVSTCFLPISILPARLRLTPARPVPVSGVSSPFSGGY